MKTRIYLAGGLNDSDWQNKVMAATGTGNFVFFNPKEHLLTDSREYTIWDLFYVRNCDILFAYMGKNNPSGFGLTLEVGFARALDKPIILVDEKSETDKDFENKFKIVRESASIVFNNLNEGLGFLKNLNNGVITV